MWGDNLGRDDRDSGSSRDLVALCSYFSKKDPKTVERKESKYYNMLSINYKLFYSYCEHKYEDSMTKIKAKQQDLR